MARGPEVDTSDSSSCHVFMAEPITSESERQIRANTFQFDLSDQDTSSSVQFPANADPVLNVIYKLRGLSPGHDEPQQQPPEQARSSPALSGAALSNSDSGIGYRDEHVAAAQVGQCDHQISVTVVIDRHGYLYSELISNFGHNSK